MKRLNWTMLHPRMTMEHLGFIPDFIFEDDPRSAREQINERYVWGGWDSFKGHRVDPDGTMHYPGDPPQMPLAKTTLHGKETIYFYNHAWVTVVQPDGSADTARLD